MIPSIGEISPVQQLYLEFIDAARTEGFAGDLQPDYANRTVLATDNSIYQVLPQVVVYPQHMGDLVLLAKLSQRPNFRSLVLSPRGGGTGTNGQSLSDGLLVDTSRHMNAILEINAKERWVRVQCGVVKDQLNAALRPYGLFFAPDLSTSNRATIGGMISTDASGQGSCRYGKTRDHVLALTTVLLDGTVWDSEPIDEQRLSTLCQRQDRVGEIHRVAAAIARDKRELIEQQFPKLNRCLTGYDLAHLHTAEGHFDLNSILCGSEGSLGLIVEAKLNLLPIPCYAGLVNIRYSDFNAALEDASFLMQAAPTSIETIDSTVLDLARKNSLWHSVAEFFPTLPREALQGVNLVEFTADTESVLTATIARFQALLDNASEDQAPGRLGYSLALGNESVRKIWHMRKQAVGLLGNVQGEARPIPFVEDAAVPPENLAAFVRDFRALLDRHKLTYGMFGHVDAGVLHVRPAIDMKDPSQEKLIRQITEEVVALTQEYNGLLWGEHGKGVRSEYAPQFFGELYPELQKIKAAFDPYNQLNPGKIATPNNTSRLLRIDEVATRGQQDRKIPVQVWQAYGEAMHCNGNGLCFNWNPHDAMCPSWKITRERIHSPKGRAALMREWLKQLSERDLNAVRASEQVQRQSFWRSLPARVKHSWQKRRGAYDFSHEVNAAMQGCLACKACAGQCPVGVNVPELRSHFFELYYSRYLRPLKDYLIGSLETVVPTLNRAPWFYNALLKPRWLQFLWARMSGLVDLPLLTGIKLDKQLQTLGVNYATAQTLQRLTAEEKKRAVIVVQDVFVRYFETPVLLDSLELLQRLGFIPLLAPFHANGKPLHVQGFLRYFARIADNNARMLNTLAGTGITLVGLEPSITLTYRSEYKKLLGEQAPQVQLLQEWLAKQPSLSGQKHQLASGDFFLLSHCVENSNAPLAVQDWVQVFSALGQQLHPLATACCGMAGGYGHERANLPLSQGIYAQSWQQAVQQPEYQGKLLATGYSCRSQVKRLDDRVLPHPVQMLLAQWRDG